MKLSREEETVSIEIDARTAALLTSALQTSARHPAIAALLRELQGRAPWEKAGPEGIVSTDEINEATESLDRYA